MNTTIITSNDNIISMKVPINIKRHGGRKMIILPDGTVAGSPTRPPDETLLKALAKAYFWQQQLDQKQYRSIDELAKRKKINSSYVSRILRMNLLAPKIKQAILDGTQPRHMSLEDFRKPLPDLWEEQVAFFGFRWSQ